MFIIVILILAQLQGHVSNQYGRIGIVVSRGGYIRCVHEISPAADAGLLPGDQITAVDGRTKFTIDDIDGDAGVEVSITVHRGTETLTYVITRVIPAQIHNRRPELPVRNC